MNWPSLGIARPAWLLLLLLIPVLWWFGRHSLRALGGFQQKMALLLRTAVLLLLILALAEVQWTRISENIAAIFLLDQSVSLSPEQRESSLEYVQAAVEKYRHADAGDRAGVIVFGKDAQVEQPPLATSSLPQKRETSLEQDYSNIAAGLRLARATFPPDAARRIVIVSDGNQNMGDALTEAKKLAAAGVSIDVAPVSHIPRSDILVENVSSPPDVRSGSPFDVTVVISNRPPPQPAPAISIPGRLRVYRKDEGRSQLIADEPLVIPPGKHVYTFRQELREPAFYTFEARFQSDNPELEHHMQNNQLSSSTQLRGKGRVLFIINPDTENEFETLISALRRSEIEVTTQPSNQLFTTLLDLQNYDSVVLANVPRDILSTGGDKITQFTDEQIEILVRNTEQLGAGLVMLGGPQSFGAGGWQKTLIEKAMPVDFEVPNSKVAAVGALCLVIDRSGSMAGEKLELSKAAAKAAAKMLTPNDYINVVAFDSAADDVVSMRKVGERLDMIQRLISHLGSGGGTNLEPGMRKGYAALQRVQASVKHMIVLTDGQTPGDAYGKLAAEMRSKGITTSSVAVGTDASRRLLQEIATQGRGKYYQATNPKVLPAIFTYETRRVARPLLIEDANGIQATISKSHEITTGIEGNFPPITGFVTTTLKDNILVEAPLVASRPQQPHNTLLATWNYGLGRSVAITTDGGQRWAKDWTGWSGYDKFFVQAIRWSMRTGDNKGDYTVTSRVKDGRLTVVVQGVSEQGEFLNAPSMNGRLAQDQGGLVRELEFRQVGPGRFISESDLDNPGNYLLAVTPGAGGPLLRSAVSVPYSPEFRDSGTNDPLLASLAAIHPAGTPPGEVIALPSDVKEWAKFTGPDIYRRDLPRVRSVTDAWPLALLLCGVLFLVDVGNRRIAIASLLQEGWTYATRRQQKEVATKMMPRAAVRLQKPPQESLSLSQSESLELSAEKPLPPTPEVTQQKSAPLAADLSEDNSYSARLLRAKKQAHGQRDT